MDNISIDNADLMPELVRGWVFNQRSEPQVLDRASTAERIELNSITAMILSYCDGKHSVQQISETLCARYPDAVDDIPGDIEEVLRQLQQQGALRFTAAQVQQVYEVPEKSPANKTRQKLCIGMATYDDYDGVYFSVQAIRLYHPEVLDQLEILVIDNHPDGPCGAALKNLGHWIPRYRYIPTVDIRGTAVRDTIFREANADYVLCIDSHVMIEAGAISRLLAYFDTSPASRDLIQGPLLNDDLNNISTHFSPVWREGMYGTWGHDDRADDVDAAPFDIPMQGLGLFACRKDAWPGFNPRFSGFGGEEGYIHEKIRQAGGRTLCLPFLRWIHRFARPMGTRYEVNWGDRIRNYVIGFEELGWPVDELVEHFKQHVGDKETSRILSEVRAELNDPLFIFDALYCLYDSEQPEALLAIQQKLHEFPSAHRMVYIDWSDFEETEQYSARDLAMQWIADKARNAAYQHVLVIDAGNFDGFLPLEILQQRVDSMDQQAWQVICLDHETEESVLLGEQAVTAINAPARMGAFACHSSLFDYI